MNDAFDDSFRAVLAEYEARDASEADLPHTLETRDQRLLPVGREGAQLLHAMIVGAGAKNILELGTSYGYSTLWLADAARKTGGHVRSLDVSAQKQAYAKTMLGKAGLDRFVTFEAGDALEIIPRLAGPFELVFLDIWKELYVPCLELVAPKLAPGGVIAADNMIHPEIVREKALVYRRAVRAKPGMASVLLSVGSGIEVSRLVGPLDEGL
ncbi:MAG: class I SAM-dependent methyltransferase [Hyphomonadaceae bacterium]|nr:class I SAM-dependent methyltransferase [Hyphomonadaceae bacterium]